MEIITFGNTTSEDLGMILARKTIGTPEIQTKYVSVPGRSGMIDMSEYITGGPVYSDRRLKFDFLFFCSESEWPDKISEIADAIHGKRLHIICGNDEDYYFNGRCETSFDPYNKVGKCSIEVEAEPFKYSVTKHDLKFEAPDVTSDEELVVSSDKKTLTISGTSTFVINMNGKKERRPTFIVSGASGLGLTFTVYSGTSVLYALTLENGEMIPGQHIKFTKATKVSVSGNGNLQIKMEEGVL